MVFTQPEFFILLSIALLVVAMGTREKLFILLCSFVFYGWWDWRFLGLILISTTIDFLAALLIAAARKNDDDTTARLALTIAVGANLGILGAFKYFDFFVSTFAAMLSSIGIGVNPTLLHITLPLGISFYTFHAISYAVDVYRGDVTPSRNYIDYLNFVTFFPQLVAGPIARASHLLPQVTKGFFLDLERFYSGSQLFLFGLAKKLLIADNISPLVDRAFMTANPTFLDIVFGGLGFMVQIYCDFSGYTDMARGVARMFGISLLDNFKFPFLVSNPRDFWRNWHISLSTWLRDYLFIPLGGSHGSRWLTARNIMITMVLGGLWHGASWNFALWGAYHGLWLVGQRGYTLSQLDKRIVRAIGQPSYNVIASISFTIIVLVSWILFRCSQSSAQLVRVFSTLLDPSFASGALSTADQIWIACSFLTVVIVQLWQRRFGPEPWRDWSTMPRTAYYSVCLLGLIWFTKEQSNPFIYFQF